jgi:phage terminase large subunit-like protein
MQTTTAPKGFDPKQWENWDQKSKDKLLAALQLAEKDKFAWFCTVGRTCNGEPHEGYDYPHARGDQWPPEGNDWLVWLLKGGRGSGKTRSGAEWIRKISANMERVSIIGPTWSHVRDIMVEGDSGLLFVFERAGVDVLWEPSKRKLTTACQCPKTRTGRTRHPNGHIIQVFTGEEPARLRGPVHWAVWIDEPAHIALIQDVWDMMMLGLRGGKRPVVLCTTTPLPIKWMTDLVADDDTVSVTVSTYENIKNLAPTFKKTVLKRYEGTRLGQQELYGEILEGVEGAMWEYDWISENRDRKVVTKEGKQYITTHTIEDMERVVIGVDPAGTSSKKRDQTGIIVVGKLGEDFYVFADGSGHFTPKGWAQRVWFLYDQYQADKVVAEKNYGGEMVLSTLSNERAEGPVELVHSRRGKELRAEPISALYEQGRVHHLKVFKELEQQMTTWVPGQGDSPDRVDALVHAITKLMGGHGPTNIATPTDEHFARAGNRFNPKPSHMGYKPREATPAVVTITVPS